VLARLGRTEEAIQAVEIALWLRPGVAPYFSHFGHLLLRAGRREDGIAAFRNALQSDPDNAGIHNLLAELMLQDQRVQDALHHATRAAACAPSEPRYQVRAADLLVRQLRLVDAIALYRRAIEVVPGDRTLHAELGRHYGRLGRLEEAAQALQLAIDVDAPGGEAPDGKVAVDLYSVLMSMGRFADARALVDRVLMAQPDEPQLRRLQAEIEAVMDARRFAPVGLRYLAVGSEEIVPAGEFTAPACLRYTNFPAMNPTFGSHHVNNLYVEKRKFVPAVNLCRLPADARLAVPNHEEFIAAAGTLVVAEQIRNDWRAETLAEAFAGCSRQESITEPAVLIGRYGIRTWGHWLGELLPKAVAVESRWPGRFRFIVPGRFLTDPVHATALESLSYYGIGRDRLVLTEAGTIYACSNLHAVTSAWSAERVLHPEVAGLMREFGPREREPAPGWLKVALLRRSTQSRNIQNLAAVEDVLVAHGFTIVDIEKLNFRQQVDLFKNVEAVACVLGSGLTGLMYAPRGVKVLTMAPGEWGDLFFYSMMQERDAVFADIRGPSTATDRDGVGTSGFTVPIEPLLAGLRAIETAAAWVRVEPASAAATLSLATA
jgi:tetratricopeptide (TPR) repeat protein